MSNITQFNADLDAFAAQLDTQIATVVRKIAVEAFNSLTNLTPVDTGRARAGWAMAIGQPSDFLPPDVAPADRKSRRKKKGVKPLKPIFEKPDPDYDVLAAVDGKQPLFITNSVEYIEALENGHSAQAPAGMVRITVAALEIGIESLSA